MKTVAMFRNKSAWFSNSAPQECQNFWVLEGGTIAGWRTADYLFSKDATCPDTLRIFESRDYLWNKVVVFHCSFLSTCEKRKSGKSVCIGHYVLPPASVQEVRNVVGRLIWECEDEQSVAEGSHNSLSCQTEDEHSGGEAGTSNSSEPCDTDSSGCEAPLFGHLRDYPVSNIFTGYVSMDNLQKYSGDLSDFHPGCVRCSNCKGCLPHL
ncbi:telomere repeats-binding bouquet formation protein 2 isoform X3 [Acanthopagrus latus]|uniref:telomere repeats-binding bouquet formation protein 2 isoform X3 n=1 Tax=Acanthopagrus latus TaxID=8177 RepID=UPI00187BCF53|nr:telomere repeats-binding bouquet formation protein 2 isoform X3 [Acanthopagrus latus]